MQKGDKCRYIWDTELWRYLKKWVEWTIENILWNKVEFRPKTEALLVTPYIIPPTELIHI